MANNGKIDLTENAMGYYLAWFGGEEEAEGDLTVGETFTTEEQEEDSFCEMFTYVSNTLRTLCPPDFGDVAFMTHTLFWETASKAKAALALARKLQKQFDSKKPWPEWALQATAEG